jgi:hypothetical protein
MKLIPPFEAWYLALILAIAAIFCGCVTEHKAVDVGGKGVYVDPKSGKMAVGSLSVSTVPADAESVVFKVDEDTAWLSDRFLRDMNLRLTGTNSVSHAEGIIKAICGTFTATNAVERTEK